MPLDAIFDLASMTKPLTAVAALMLLEEGRYIVNDPISAYLPEFKNPKVQPARSSAAPTKRSITVHDLLTHTSGISDPRSRAETFAFPTLAAYIKDVARLPLQAQPGSTWIYGDSFDVLGYLVEQVSGTPLDRFIAERILKPLGMSDTDYWPTAEKDSRRAVLVVDGKDDPDSTSRRPLAAAQAKTFIGGASGLYSTAADYWRFSQMLLDGGSFSGRRLLGPKTIAWMSQNHIADNSTYEAPGLRFGLGFAVVTDPGSLGYPYSKGAYFWGGSQGTVFWIDPAEELTGVLMVQVTPNGQLRLREKFAAIVYSAIKD
jgi:CubicO group peptidase (beta-lactamase class C family)